MPLFYLHVRTASGLIQNREGSELPDLDAAKVVARQGIRDIVAEHIAAGEPLDLQGIEVCDDAGRDIATVTVADAISQTIKIPEDSFPTDLTKYLNSQYNPCDEDAQT
ncbi:MAG: DUF6894 family protein [Pseudorhizobium sp.]